MLNKNYIIIGAIILAIIAGAIFWSRNNSSTPDASVLERGVKNLTREKAAEMIKTSFEVSPLVGLYLGKAFSVSYDEETGGYTLPGGDEAKLLDLEKAGFIKVLPKKSNWDWRQKVSFTEKTKPYLRLTGASEDDKYKYILLAEVVSVEVTGITEATEKDGKTIRVADFTAKFKPTPIGVINDEKQAAQDVKSQAQFVLYDDGWRIAQ